MDILTRLKTWIPTVLAAQSDNRAVADQNTFENGPQEVTEVEVNANGDLQRAEKKQVDLSIRPESYTDILIDREGSYEYFPERKERYKAPVWKRFTMTGGLEEYTRASCEKKLYNIMKEGKRYAILCSELMPLFALVDLHSASLTFFVLLINCYRSLGQAVDWCFRNIRMVRGMTVIVIK